MEGTCDYHKGGWGTQNSGSPSDTRCYSDPWADEVHVQDIGRQFVSIDVGCNTGVNSIAWLAKYGDKPGVIHDWSEGLRNIGVGTGACSENFKNNRTSRVSRAFKKNILAGPLDYSGPLKPRAICVEPMPDNVKLLNTVKAQVSSAGGLEVVNAAVSNATGTASFPVGGMGQEDLGLSSAVVTSERREDVQVEVTTVDKLVEDRNLDHVDVLTIDTEGHDPAVLQGARKTLREKGVGLLVFEVHQDKKGTPWSQTTLFSVVEELASLQFDCYWARHDGHLKRLTGCWTIKREDKLNGPIGWSNVACARFESPWHRAFTAYTV